MLTDYKPKERQDLEELYIKQNITIYELDQENKKLIKENKKLRDYADNLDSENDNQAIEIEELKKKNGQLKIHIEAKDKAYMDLLADYNYLKARIKKTERAFLKYEDKQEKLLGELDMIVMNR